MQAVGFGPLMSLESQVYVIEDEETLTLQKSDVSLVISISLGGSSLLILTIIGCRSLKKRRRKDERIVDME